MIISTQEAWLEKHYIWTWTSGAWGSFESQLLETGAGAEAREAAAVLYQLPQSEYFGQIKILKHKHSALAHKLSSASAGSKKLGGNVVNCNVVVVS